MYSRFNRKRQVKLYEPKRDDAAAAIAADFIHQLQEALKTGMQMVSQ